MSQPVAIPPPPPPEARPAPRFSIRVARWLDDRLRSPVRFYFGHDGDWTNEHLWFGVEWVQAGYDEPLLSLGLELVVPPRMFWLLKPLRLWR